VNPCPNITVRLRVTSTPAADSSPSARTHNTRAYHPGDPTDGPLPPDRYRRDINGNYTRTLNDREEARLPLPFRPQQLRFLGQIPLDLASDAVLQLYIDPSDGGRVRLGTAAGYFSRILANGDTFKADGFVSRSLFDLYSNFTFYLNDPVHGDAFQQHDSRLQRGLNTQYTHAHKLGPVAAVLVAGANFHDNQINVGLYPRDGREPTGVDTRADAHDQRSGTCAGA
jgi:hypothetical protein